MEPERAAYVALALTPGIGPSRLQAILDVCHTATGALSAPFAFLRSIPGISAAAATAIASTDPASGVRAVEAAQRVGGRTLIAVDPEYPELLRQIPDPPPLLFVLGDLSLLERPAVAIVGSRDHTTYGAEVARALAWGLGSGGIVVVSGMARGLDAVAHAGALDGGGGTIGVLGNGLGVVYPAANRALYQRVAERGLLLTEFPPGEKPTAGSFPRRNRLISGLARVTVVVEAAEGSGALITAGTALDQGRDVMAVPGPITSPSSVGTNRLIRTAPSRCSHQTICWHTTPKRCARPRGSPRCHRRRGPCPKDSAPSSAPSPRCSGPSRYRSTRSSDARAARRRTCWPRSAHWRSRESWSSGRARRFAGYDPAARG